MIGLRREVTEQDRAQLEYVMPLIQSGLNKTAKAFSDCIAVKDTLTSWYAVNICFATALPVDANLGCIH